jgi:hypothetical protein
MLDPRIYRMCLAPVVLAVILLAFSLENQQGALSSNLAPDAYSGGYANATMNALAKSYPDRRPGSEGDNHLARYVAGQLKADGFEVSTDAFRGRTVDGPRTLENVVGVRAGLGTGSIVLVAHRDALSSPATADLSGTATLLALARVLSGETQQRTVVLASTSGSAGASGALRLARSLQQPVDAVVVLGDLAGKVVRQPVVVPWSDGQQVAPPVLRNTLTAALVTQARLPAGTTGLIGQLAHLAIPMAPSEQGPFGLSGEPAVLLSVSGERGPSAREPTSLAQLSGMGSTVLQAVNALDSGPQVPAPSTYLGFSGKSIPAWSVSLLVLMLILAVLVTTVDALARARRRGHSILRWTGWVLSAALPFALAVLVVIAARVLGLIAAAPPGPVGRGAIAVHGGGIALLATIACVVVVGLVWVRPVLVTIIGPRPARVGREPYGDGAAAALLLILCVVALVVWFANPFAAVLLVPALHLWMWIVVPGVRLPRPVVIVLLAAGFALPAVVALSYALTLGLNPLELAWSCVLLLAGGAVGVLSALEWSVVLGCAFSVIALAWRAARAPRPEAVPVTTRGPVSYAGPGSLGGTESALRR